jgi:hypothetical protein
MVLKVLQKALFFCDPVKAEAKNGKREKSPAALRQDSPSCQKGKKMGEKKRDSKRNDGCRRSAANHSVTLDKEIQIAFSRVP